MDDVLERIESWLASGLIDEATAARLRATVSTRTEAQVPRQAAPESATLTQLPVLGDVSSAVSAFGPTISIGELFGYLGGAFLLAAWAALVAELGDGSEFSYGVGAAIGALGVAVVGLALGRADPRRSRAAGVCFLVSTLLAMGAGVALAESAEIDAPVAFIVGGVFGTAASAAFRWHHPALLTQVAVLASVTVLATASLQWISEIIGHPAGRDDEGYFRRRTGPDPVFLVIGQALWWMAWALGFGYVGLLEDRKGSAAGDASARRRAALTRFWAGLVAVLGLSAAVRLEEAALGYDQSRVVPAVIGDLAILMLCAVLIERAFRRDATAFLWAAAVGVVIALTDLNFSYLEDDTWVALLIEGAILAAVGLSADRLRRMLRGLHPGGRAARHTGHPRPPQAPVPG